MNNAYANQTQQSGNSLAYAIEQQKMAVSARLQEYPQAIRPSAPGVIDMTASAHEAFEVLSQALGELISKVGPLVEPYPEPGCAEGMQDQKCESFAVAGLRRLIERINDKTAEIQRLTAALRV